MPEQKVRHKNNHIVRSTLRKREQGDVVYNSEKICEQQ